MERWLPSGRNPLVCRRFPAVVWAGFRRTPVHSDCILTILQAIPGVDFIVASSGGSWKIWNPEICDKAESAYSTSCTSKNRAFLECKETMVVSLPKKMRPKLETDERAEFERELPEEILEAIVARMPFPSVFKARVLSESWYYKLTGFSCEVSAFQRQVYANSASWRTYAPVLINWTNMSLLAPDRISNFFNDRSKSQWFELPPNMWHDIRAGWVDGKPDVRLAGALVLLGGMVDLPSDHTSIFSVGNVITGSWRHLKLEPHFGSHTRAFRGPIWTLTRNKYIDNQALHGLLYLYQNCAYMDEKVYFLALHGPNGEWLASKKVKLVSYDIENTAWTIMVEASNSMNTVWTIAPEEFADSMNPRIHEKSGVFRCGQEIIVVIMSEEAILVCYPESVREGVGEGFYIGKIREKSIQVFQLDIQSLELVSISNGPPEITVLLNTFDLDPNPILSTDANFLYICWDCIPNSMLKFDLNSRKWSSIPLASSRPDFDWRRHQLGWIQGALEPGLNPFVWAG